MVATYMDPITQQVAFIDEFTRVRDLNIGNEENFDQLCEFFFVIHKLENPQTYLGVKLDNYETMCKYIFELLILPPYKVYCEYPNKPQPGLDNYCPNTHEFGTHCFCAVEMEYLNKTNEVSTIFQLDRVTMKYCCCCQWWSKVFIANKYAEIQSEHVHMT